MANTTILTDTTLDVISKFREIVAESLSEDGLYIRTREVVNEMIANGDLTGAEKSKIITGALTNMTAQITASAMELSLKWSSMEKEFILKNAESSAKVDSVRAEINKAEEELKVLNAEKRNKQSQAIRLYGVPTLDTEGNVVALSDAGKEYEATKMIKEEQLTAQSARSKIADDLLTSAKNRDMIDKQTLLYVRQTQGFDDNKYQKLFDSQIQSWAVMYSSGMLETMPAIISSDKVSTLYTKLTAGL